MHIGMKIKKLREQKLWTHAQLAEFADVSDRTIRRIEAGENAEKTTLLLVLDALDTNIDELNNMFNKGESRKAASTKKTNIKFLHRIESGRELVRIIASAHSLGYDYPNCNGKQLEDVQSFLSSVADVMDIWNMIEIGQRFELENLLSTQMRGLEEYGLWVFGNRQVDADNNWITAVINVCSKENPLIQKGNIDTNLMQKNELL